MGQGSAGNIIDADIDQGGNIFLSDVARAFRFGPAVDDSYGFLHHVVAHVVQHDDVSPGFDGFADHVQVFRFDFDFADEGRIGLGHGLSLIHI